MGEKIESLNPDSLKVLLWGSGPVPEGFSHSSEVMEFRGRRDSLAQENKNFRIIFWVTGIFLFLIYHTFFFARKGQTPGKGFFKLKVCREDGKAMNWGQSFLRSFLYLISALPFGLGFFWIKLDVKHRTWHDKLSGTKVTLA